MSRSLSVVSCVCALLLISAPTAAANWFGGSPVAGPGDIGSADVALARNGAGGVAYTSRYGPAAHVFVRRLYQGEWQPPQQLDAGIEGSASEVSIAAVDAVTADPSVPTDQAR